MTNDEIQKIANEVWAAGTVYIGPSIDSLARFAALAYAAGEAAERAQCLTLCEAQLAELDYAEAAGAHACVEAIRAALDDHVGGVTNMVTTEPDNLLRRAADELDKEQA